MMEHDSWEKYFATCSIINILQELIKIAQLYSNVMFFYANMERFFP